MRSGTVRVNVSVRRQPAAATAAPSGEPIWIPCEGAEFPGHLSSDGVAMCSMCGRFHPTGDAGLLVAHDRDDILARIVRGDFG